MAFNPLISPRFKKSMRLAIVHDYLIQMGDADRVVAAMAEACPKAPMILTSVTDTNRLLPEFRDHHIGNTWMDALPGIRKHFKKYFTLFPAAFRSVGPVDVDVAWINSSGFAHWLPLIKTLSTSVIVIPASRRRIVTLRGMDPHPRAKYDRVLNHETEVPALKEHQTNHGHNTSSSSINNIF